jgi:hypothetical protein
MTRDNKNSVAATLLQKIKSIQDQNPYKSINDMEINKYYKIKNAKYGINMFKSTSATITIEEDGELYDLILPSKFKFSDDECEALIKYFEIGVIEKRKKSEFDFREYEISSDKDT